MKLVKTASGKKTIKMSKSEWEAIGKTAGWIDGIEEGEDSGISLREPQVGYDNYKGQPDSAWGEHVGDVGANVRDKNMLNIPNYYLLHGGIGTGKSVWADALADLLGIDLKTIDFSNIARKYVGEAEQGVRRVIETILNSKDTVFLIDEIDRQLQMMSGGNEGFGGHEVYTRTLIKSLLNAMEDNKAQLKENNVYIVMTVNDIGGVDEALISRMQGNVYEVGGENHRGGQGQGQG